tara:strand:+ start:2156 stop:2758 length:603 start_codon:yes stop_codon:yes gene_type:complete
MAKYHKYVFDEQGKRLVGAFEDMYKAEDTEGFDSWQSQNVRHLRHRLALEILDDYNFSSVLEIGCGKGSMTQFLKKANNRVLGIDISPTAVEKAKASHPEIEFRAMDALAIDTLDETFDLAAVMMTLAYVSNWRGLLAKIASVADNALLVEYIPDQAIGAVKSLDDARQEFEKHFNIATDIVLDRNILMLFGTRRGSKTT